MPELIILGSSDAVPSEDHENTHMILVGEARVVLIDCSSNPVVRLKKVGLEALNITDLIVTHFHPDHVAGVPLFLLDSWLLGRKAPLNIYGLEATLDRLRQMMMLFGWDEWPGFFPVDFHPVAEQEMAVVLESHDFKILASPVEHLIPNLGLRIESINSGKVLAYSGDTSPSDGVVRLARGADVLIHEASGETIGHTSAAQAGEIARQAGAKRLYLIHYRTWEFDPNPLVEESRQTFPGPVSLAVDFQRIEL